MKVKLKTWRLCLQAKNMLWKLRHWLHCVGDLVEKLEHIIFLGIKYVNLCKLGCPVVFNGVKNPSIDTENTSVGDLVEKLEDFIFFGLKYVNLC